MICLAFNSPSPLLPSSPTSSPSNGDCASSSLENANLTTRSAYLHLSQSLLNQPQILKPILHSLLIPGTLSFLSVASNRKLRTPAFRLIGAYAKKVSSFFSFQFIHSSLKGKESPIPRPIPKHTRQEINRIHRSRPTYRPRTRTSLPPVRRLSTTTCRSRNTM